MRVGMGIQYRLVPSGILSAMDAKEEVYFSNDNTQITVRAEMVGPGDTTLDPEIISWGVYDVVLDIIKENGLATDVAIASDNFHQLRAEIFAKKNGLTAYSAGNPTYLFVAPGYWTREILAVYKAVILGY